MNNSEWQPIETAPKKEEQQILCWDGKNRTICEWLSFGDGNGEWDVCHDAESYAWSGYAPTHWMPLPEAPQ